MDALAATGVKLENYYVQAVCSPTRAAIMTGRYATHTGIHVPLVDTAPGVLPNDEVLLPALLRDAGYATHMVGNWAPEFGDIIVFRPRKRKSSYFLFGVYR